MRHNFMVVDDDPNICRTFLLRFKNTGAALHIADCPAEAHEILDSATNAQSLPDTIVTDGHFADGDSLDFDSLLAVYTARKAPYPEIIFYTGNGRYWIGEQIAALAEKYPQFKFGGFEKPDNAIFDYIITKNPQTTGYISVRDGWNQMAQIFPRLSFEKAVKAARDATIPTSILAYGLRPYDLLQAFNARVREQDTNPATVAAVDGGLGHALVGRAVFSAETARQLKADKCPDKIILITNGGSQTILQNMSVIDGAINIGEVADHFNTILRSARISAVTTTSADIHAMPARFQQGPFVIHEGDIITIDPSAKKIHADAMPIESPAPLESIALIKETLRIAERHPAIAIAVQADTAQDSTFAAENGLGIGLARLENFFLHGAGGVDTLLAYLANPGEEERVALKTFITTYIRSTFFANGAKLPTPPTFRLFDCKPDEIFKNPAQAEAIETLYQLDDLRGTNLAAVLPDFYQAQIEAIQEALPANQSAGIATPMVEDSILYDCLSRMVANVAAIRDARITSIPMIETLKGLDLAAQLIAGLPANGTLMIGTSDLMSDIMGGVGRNDTARTQQWMQTQNDITLNPFETITPPLENALRRVITAVANSGKEIKTRVCGVQAQHIDGLMTLESLSIREACVPANPRLAMGLPVALGLARTQSRPAARKTINEIKGSLDAIRLKLGL